MGESQASTLYGSGQLTVTENLNHYRADVGDTLEFGWDSYGDPNRYYTKVVFDPGNYGIQITLKDFTKATDWEKEGTTRLQPRLSA